MVMRFESSFQSYCLFLCPCISKAHNSTDRWNYIAHANIPPNRGWKSNYSAFSKQNFSHQLQRELKLSYTNKYDLALSIFQIYSSFSQNLDGNSTSNIQQRDHFNPWKKNYAFSRGRSPEDYENYIEELRKRTKEDPMNGKFWIELSKTLENVEEKRAALMTGIEHNSNNSYLWHALAMNEWRLARNINKAMETLELGINACVPGNRGKLYHTLAMISSQKDDSRENIIKIFETAINDQPNYEPSYLALAQLYDNLHTPEKAMEVLVSATKNVRQCSESWRLLSTLREREGDITKALQCLLNAVKIAPTRRNLYLEIARLGEAADSIGFARNSLEIGLRRIPGDWKLLKQLGELEARDGNVERARRIFRGAAKKERLEEGRGTKVLQFWGEFEAKNRNFEMARKIFDSIIAENPRNMRAILSLGNLETECGNYEEARLVFAKCEGIESRNPNYLYSLAKCELSAGNELEAEILFAKAVKSTKDSYFIFLSRNRADVLKLIRVNALKEWSGIAYRNGEFSKCEMVLREAVQIDSSDPSLWQQLADVTSRSSGTNEADNVYSLALQKLSKENHHLIYHWWGLTHRKRKNITEARKCFRKSVEVDPGYVTAWISLGLLEKVHSEDNLDTCCKIFNEAANSAELMGTSTPYLYQIWGQTEQDRGNFDEARNVYIRGAKINSTNGSLYLALGNLEEQQGRFAEARKQYNSGIKVDPCFGGLYQSWALLEARQERLSQAITILEQGHLRDPKNPELLVTRAILENQRKEYETGRQLFLKAVELDPMNGTTWHGYGISEIALGNIERGKALLHLASATKGISNWELGKLSLHSDDIEGARGHFENGLKVDPAFSLNYVALANLEKNQKNRANEARKILKQGAMYCPCVEIFEALVELETSENNTQALEEIFKQAMKSVAPKLSLINQFVQHERKSGNTEAVRNIFKEADKKTQGGSDRAALYEAWGTFEANVGNIKAARELLSKSTSLDPTNPKVWAAFANFEENLGNFSRAQELRQSAAMLSDVLISE